MKTILSLLLALLLASGAAAAAALPSDSFIQEIPAAANPDAPAYNAQGLIYYHAGSYAKAHTCFTNAIVLDPTFADAYENRSRNYQAIGAYSAAAADQNRAAELREKNK